MFFVVVFFYFWAYDQEINLYHSEVSNVSSRQQLSGGNTEINTSLTSAQFLIRINRR